MYNRNLLWKQNKIKKNNHLSEEHRINHGVRQDYTLSPKLYNIYTNEMIEKWNLLYGSEIWTLR